MRHTWGWLLVLVLVGLIGLSGCGKSGSDPPLAAPTAGPSGGMTPASLTSPASGATSAARDATAVGDAVTIKDFSYHPAELRVPVGTQVTWTNLDTVAHSVTGSGFDSGLLSQGQSWSHVFAAAGTYDYHCQPHPYMTGTVIVG